MPHPSATAELTPDDFAGMRVLVVEDEIIVAMLIEDMLLDFGCAVAALAGTIDEAEIRAASAPLDAALLDVNVRGRNSFGVAQMLRARGIPFAFATGYGAGSVPSDLQSVPVLAKPFQQQHLRDILRRLRAASGDGPGPADKPAQRIDD